jgi:hypothetical protein
MYPCLAAWAHNLYPWSAASKASHAPAPAFAARIIICLIPLSQHGLMTCIPGWQHRKQRVALKGQEEVLAPQVFPQGTSQSGRSPSPRPPPEIQFRVQGFRSFVLRVEILQFKVQS